MSEKFNLNDYETVDQRLRRFWADEANADARIVTINHTSDQDRQVSTWVIEARIYMNREDQLANLPKATGWAFEVDGVGMTQKTAALETAETSAIGRCLANMNYSGNVRASREEMEKAQRGVTPKAPTAPVLTEGLKQSILNAMGQAKTKADIRKIWKANGAVLTLRWENSLGELVTFQELLTNKAAELPEGEVK